MARLTQADTTGASVSDLAKTYGARGTLPYMAPEQLCGQKVDSRSDVWAIGAVLYEMATACRPFPQTESGELMIAILQLPPEPPRSKNPNVSSGLEAVILKALSKRPAERYQSATELGADLAKLFSSGFAVESAADGLSAFSSRSVSQQHQAGTGACAVHGHRCVFPDADRRTGFHPAQAARA